jgi:uncharacterized protein
MTGAKMIVHEIPQPVIDATAPPPAAGPVARGLLVALEAYRLLLSPWIGNACRFEPSCSRYAAQAVQAHGAVVGSALAAARLARCHPWCEAGCDPVPSRDDLARRHRLLTRLLDRDLP